MATQPIDYTALAKQAGSISDTPPPAASAAGQPIDYAALAKQAGAISSTPPPPPPGFVDSLKNAAQSAVQPFVDHAKQEQGDVDAQPSMLGKVWQTAKQGLSDEGNTALGALKGLAHTAAGAAQFVTGAPVQQMVGDKLDAKGPDQAIGRGAEQAAEFLVPGAAASEVAKPALAAIDSSTAVPAFLKVLGKAGVTGATQAAASGTASQLQGDKNPGAAAAIAGGMGAAGELASPLGPVLKNMAKSQYGKFLNPTKETTKYEADQVIPGLLDRKVMATSGQGLSDKAGAQMSGIGQKINDAVANVPTSVQPNVQSVLDSIDAQKSKFLVSGVPPSANAQASVDALEKAKQGILNVVTAPGAQISYQSLNQARQILDKTVADAGGYLGKSVADTSALAADKAAAKAIRTELAKQSPDIAALNTQFHFWSQVKDVIDQTNARRVGQQGGLGRILWPSLGAASGLAHGGPTEAVGYSAGLLALNEAIRSPAWRTFSAVEKNSLANAFASGQFAQVSKILGQLTAGATSSRSSAPPSTQ